MLLSKKFEAKLFLLVFLDEYYWFLLKLFKQNDQMTCFLSVIRKTVEIYSESSASVFSKIVLIIGESQGTKETKVACGWYFFLEE